MRNKNFKFGNTAGWLNATRLRLLGNHGRVIDLFNDNGVLSMRTDRGKIRQLIASQSSGYCDIVITTETDIETYLNGLDFNSHPEGTSLFVATSNYEKTYACISSGSFWYYEEVNVATNLSIKADDVVCAKDVSTVSLTIEISNLSEKTKEWDVYISESVTGYFASEWLVGSVISIKADDVINLTLTIDKSKITYGTYTESRVGSLYVRLPGVSTRVKVTVYNDDYSLPESFDVTAYDTVGDYYRVRLDDAYGDLTSVFEGQNIRLNYNNGESIDLTVTNVNYVMMAGTYLTTNGNIFSMAEVTSVESVELI